MTKEQLVRAKLIEGALRDLALAAAVEALKKIEGTDGSGYLVDFEMRQVAAGALAIVRKLAPAGMA